MRPALALAAPCAALLAVPAAAALAPHYQRLAELNAVLALQEVAALGVPVARVEYVRRDLYRVSAGNCRLDVAIVDLPTPPNIVGARRFEARAGRRICGR